MWLRWGERLPDGQGEVRAEKRRARDFELGAGEKQRLFWHEDISAQSSNA